MFFALFSTKRKWIVLIASCLTFERLTFENFQENNVYFFHSQFTNVSSYSSSNHYLDRRAIVFHQETNKIWKRVSFFSNTYDCFIYFKCKMQISKNNFSTFVTVVMIRSLIRFLLCYWTSSFNDSYISLVVT